MKKAVIALGFFDGVHKGHEKIIKTAAQIARERSLSCVCLTFATHPQALVSGKAPEMITTDEEKARLMKKCGAEKVISLPFDEKTAGTPPSEFVRFLKEELSCAVAVCGENFRFGKGAAGKPSDIEKYGVEVFVCGEVAIDGKTVSSTLIRELVKRGDVERARVMLGRPFSLSGKVARGRGVGRKLSFPTANIAPQGGMLIPKNGVYATVASVGNKEYAAVTDVGARPTFGGGEVTVESHLPGFSGDLYGKKMTVRFMERIRDEKRFENAEELSRQIDKDVSFAREYFSKEDVL